MDTYSKCFISRGAKIISLSHFKDVGDTTLCLRFVFGSVLCVSYTNLKYNILFVFKFKESTAIKYETAYSAVDIK